MRKFVSVICSYHVVSIRSVAMARAFSGCRNGKREFIAGRTFVLIAAEPRFGCDLCNRNSCQISSTSRSIKNDDALASARRHSQHLKDFIASPVCFGRPRQKRKTAEPKRGKSVSIAVLAAQTHTFSFGAALRKWSADANAVRGQTRT